MNWAVRVRRLAGPALWGLRTYWGTSLLLLCAAALGLAALVPVTELMGSGGGLTGTRLLFSTTGASLVENGWAGATRTPAATQQVAIEGLFHLMTGIAVAAGTVAIITLLGVFGARAPFRGPELVVRRAVGASRRLLVGGAAFEGVALALAGLVVGGGGGAWLASIAAAGWPGALRAAAHGPSLLAGGALGLLVVGCALLPLVFARGRRIVDASEKPRELVIPAMQLGLSLVVLSAGGFLARQAGTRLEMARQRGMAGEVFRGTVADSAPSVRASEYAALLRALRESGTFEAVSLTGSGVLVGLGTVSTVTTDCGQCSEGGLFLPWHMVPATHQFVSADSFHALGVRVLAGRGIDDRDRWGSRAVAVVSRSLALRHFENGEAIGRKMLVGDDRRTWHTVVGVVEDPVPGGLGAGLQPSSTVYLSVLQHPVATVDLLLRPRGAIPVDATTVAIVRRVLGRPGSPPVRTTEAELLSADVLPLRWFARWMTLEGWLMLALAGGGTFALMRLWVTSLLGELGLRRALGARRREVVGFVLLRAAGVGLGGIAVGLGLGPAVWSVMPGIPAWDPGIIARYAVQLIVCAMLGALPPAWRAARAMPSAHVAWT